MSRSVVVIGAGASGLAAADALLSAGVDVRVVEAGKSLGGRIRALTDFCDVPVELGAEEIHGHDNFLYELAKQSGLEIITHSTADDAIRFDGKLEFLGAEMPSEVKRAMEWMGKLQEYRGPNRSVQDQLILDHFPSRAVHYLQSRLGVEHGTSIDRLSMRGFHNYESDWEAREHNYTVLGSLLEVLKPLADRVGPITELSCPINCITWRETPVVHALDGRTWRADAVVVTASVAALRAGLLRFDPLLPLSKTEAIQSISMDGGMKVILKFRERFWPDRMYFLHTDGFLPQFWSTCRKKSADPRVLTAFIGGARYEEMKRLGVDAVEFVLGELETIFGGKVRCVEDSYVMDWASQAYIGGLYSYVGMKERETDRGVLALSLADKLFFAGEAADTTGNHGTAHGALESGRRAAREIITRFAG